MEGNSTTRGRTVSIEHVEDHVELTEHGVSAVHTETEMTVTQSTTTPPNSISHTRNM
jgi:hypothetical protein